jgi:hypothetical protein
MRRLAGLILVAMVTIVVATACKSGSPARTDAGLPQPCSDLEHAIPFASQRMGDCVVALMPLGRSACPAALGANCGSASACGSGWDLVCDPPGSDTNCIANPTVPCTIDGPGSATYHYVLTYNGVDGVIEQVGSDTCQFVPCK